MTEGVKVFELDWNLLSDEAMQPWKKIAQAQTIKCRWQTQYDLTEKTAPVNTSALLVILEKIENNAEVEAKPPSMIKPNKGLTVNARWSLLTPASPKSLHM